MRVARAVVATVLAEWAGSELECLSSWADLPYLPYLPYPAPFSAPASSGSFRERALSCAQQPCVRVGCVGERKGQDGSVSCEEPAGWCVGRAGCQGGSLVGRRSLLCSIMHGRVHAARPAFATPAGAHHAAHVHGACPHPTLHATSRRQLRASLASRSILLMGEHEQALSLFSNTLGGSYTKPSVEGTVRSVHQQTSTRRPCAV